MQLGGQPELRLPLTDAETIEHLAARYYLFRFAPDAHTVVFHNPYAQKFWKELLAVQDGGDPPSLAATAIFVVKIEGHDWEVHDEWDYWPAVAFCRDTKGERIEEVVVIIGNREWKDRTHKLGKPGPQLRVNNIGCWRWSGTFKTVVERDSMTTTVEGNVTFERVLPFLPGEGHWALGFCQPFSMLEPVGGSANLRMQGRWVGSNCSVEGSGGPFPIERESTRPVNRIRINNYAYPDIDFPAAPIDEELGRNARRYGAELVVGGTTTHKIQCPDGGEIFDAPEFGHALWLPQPAGSDHPDSGVVVTVEENGRLTGNKTFWPDSFTKVSTEWDLGPETQ